MKEVEFDLISIDGNFSRLSAEYIYIFLNLTDAIGNKYFEKDLTVCSIKVEKENHINDINLHIRIEVERSELDIEDLLYLKVTYATNNETFALGCCSLNILDNEGLQYKCLNGIGNIEFIDWQMNMNKLKRSKIKRVLLEEMKKKCTEVLESSSVFYLKVAMPYFEFENAACEQSFDNSLHSFPITNLYGIENDMYETVTEFNSLSKWKRLFFNSERIIEIIHYAKYETSIEIDRYFVAIFHSIDVSYLRRFSLILFTCLLFDKNTFSNCVLERMVKEAELACLFNWFLKSKSDMAVAKNTLIVEKISVNFHQKRKKYGENLKEFQAQSRLVEELRRIVTSSTYDKSLRIGRTEILKRILKNNKKIFPITHPLFFECTCYGIISNSIHIFSSTQMPIKFQLITDNALFNPNVIFKYGDDIRQDEFALQTIKFIGDIWKRNYLELEITTYEILNCGNGEGLVEFVNALPLSVIAEKYTSLMEYLVQVSLDNGENAVIVIKRFVKSCAGYCLISYLLGVGDRHLDNLMVDCKGRFFHIDYAYLFGQDPKPFPPQVKLTSEIMDVIGDEENALYGLFTNSCLAGLELLRKNFNSLAQFMGSFVNAELEHFPFDEENLVKYLKERLFIDENPRNAMLRLISVIKASSRAIFPQVLDRLHKWSQDWKE